MQFASSHNQRTNKQKTKLDLRISISLFFPLSFFLTYLGLRGEAMGDKGWEREPTIASPATREVSLDSQLIRIVRNAKVEKNQLTDN